MHCSLKYKIPKNVYQWQVLNTRISSTFNTKMIDNEILHKIFKQTLSSIGVVYLNPYPANTESK